MANPFQVEPVNALQAMLMQGHGMDAGFKPIQQRFAMQEQLGKQRGRDLLSQMLQSGGQPDYGKLAIGMLASGDAAGAGVLANLVNQQAQRGFQEQSLDLQRQAANKPIYQQVEGPDGSKQLIMIEPHGRSASVVNPTGQATEATNPFSQGKGTDEQQKARLYASRMFAAEKVLRETETAGTDLTEKLKSKVPLIGNYLVSDEYQKADQAKRDFINATLRRESGAVINPDEFDNANKQYFPQPGDSKTTIEQKRRNRAEAIKGIAGAGGQSYRPPATFDAQGNLVPNAPKPQNGGPQTDKAGILAQAQDAIKRGANPQAVAKRLLDNGISPDEIGLTY